MIFPLAEDEMRHYFSRNFAMERYCELHGLGFAWSLSLGAEKVREWVTFPDLLQTPPLIVFNTMVD